MDWEWATNASNGSIREHESPQIKAVVVSLGVLGILLNFLMLILLISLVKSRENNKIHPLIINQTVIDLLVSMAVVADYSQKIYFNNLPYDCNVIGRVRCFLFDDVALISLPVDASLMNLLVITIERYVKIVHAVIFRKCYRTWMMHSAFVLPWIFSAVFTASAAATTRLVDGYCVTFYSVMRPKFQVLLFLYNTVFFIIPTTTYLVCYIRIARKVNQMGKRIGTSHQEEDKQILNKRTFNVAKTMAVSSASYAISVFPQSIFFFSLSFNIHTKRHADILNVGLACFHCNCILNPIIYSAQYRPVKKRLYGIFRRKNEALSSA